MKRTEETSDYKIHPLLRVVKNRDDVVNACGAEFSTRLATSDFLSASEKFDSPALDASLSFALGTVTGDQIPKSPKASRRPSLGDTGASRQAYVNVFIEVFQGSWEGTGAARQVMAELERLLIESALAQPAERDVFFPPRNPIPQRNLISATIPVALLAKVADLPEVAYIHAAESISLSIPPVLSTPTNVKPTPRAVTAGGAKRTGTGVLIGIIDVGGFDFAHPDFLDVNGNTRFEAIWDQGGSFRGPPSKFGYGSELTADRLSRAIAREKAGGMPAIDMELQSQRVPGSHGTHVASIAAGNSGICAGARIAAVLVSIPVAADVRERRQSTFSDSSRITDAIEYLFDLGKKLSLPVSINISLGTNGGPHDGSNGPCRWIDASLTTPGRAICLAAGNAGQQDGVTPDDLGWMMGRIHTMGQIKSAGLDVDLEWIVVGDGIADVSENELEIWYSPQDRITVSVMPPGSNTWYSVSPGEFIQNKRMANGTFLSIYNEKYHPSNGDNYISIYLSPNLAPESFAPIAPGVWKVRLHGDEIRYGHFHAWIERDDPMELERKEKLRAYRFPSFFSKNSNVDSHSIGSLACAHRAIAVANEHTSTSTINISSSQGPTREGRNKPDIAAPGTDIVAACGFHDEQDWISMTGTSMASPFVCGVVGLMLAARSNLNAAQCEGILKRTARPLPSHGYEWRSDAGYGVIDPVAAINEALYFDARTER